MPGLELIVTAAWAGAMAGAMSVIFSAPPSRAPVCFVGGMVGRLARDVLVQQGASMELASIIASALVVGLAVVLIRGAGTSPVVMASALLPLGATTAFFRAIMQFIRISTLPPEQHGQVAVELVANLSKVFTTSISIAIGISAALFVARLIKPAAARDAGVPAEGGRDPVEPVPPAPAGAER